MNNKKKVSEIFYTVVFLLVTVFLGLLSFINLVNFYVNDIIDYNEWTADLGNRFETDEATTFYGKIQFVNFNGALRNILGQREMNGITKLNNGHLVIPQQRMTDEQIKTSANEVIKYAEYCRIMGKTFLFVQPILKIDKNNKQLPSGVEDYSNENIDIFLSCLKEANIDVLDIRESMKNDGINMYDYTYVTDHHWTTEGGFYSFVQITNWIDNNLKIKVNPIVTDLNNYCILKYSGWNLGSYGRRVGVYFAGVDDYDLITPSFDVSFIDDEGKAHSFNDSVVETSMLEHKDIWNKSIYDCATHCPSGVATTSTECSVLFVTDSYVDAMEPFIKLAYSNYYYYYYPNGFSTSYVIQTNPDIIIFMPYYTSTFNEGAVYIE